MRITGGRARGIALECPPKDTRPATDTLREALFSSLGKTIEDVRLLDVFAGTGAYGLEAISRGAREVTFIEKQPAALACLRKNLLNVCKSAERNAITTAHIRPMDALKNLTSLKPPFDLIIADPPYTLLDDFCKLYCETLCTLLTASEHARFILETPADREPSTFSQLTLVKRIGKLKSQSPTLLVYAQTSSPHSEVCG